MQCQPQTCKQLHRSIFLQQVKLQLVCAINKSTPWRWKQGIEGENPMKTVFGFELHLRNKRKTKQTTTTPMLNSWYNHNTTTIQTMRGHPNMIVWYLPALAMPCHRTLTGLWWDQCSGALLPKYAWWPFSVPLIQFSKTTNKVKTKLYFILLKNSHTKKQITCSF